MRGGPHQKETMEHSFRTYVDYCYVGFGGLFGVTPYSALVPRWSVGQLATELMGEYIRAPKNFNVGWKEDETQCLGIIQDTLNKYAGLLGKWSQMKAQNDPAEDPGAAAWEAWRAANAAA
jgi:hypothetical protein